MTLSVEMVTVDCVAPERLARWWADAVGGDVVVLAPGEFALVSRSQGPALGFQRVDGPTPGKNRVHLDFASAELDAEVARLVGLGASELGRHSVDGGFRWVVLADPDDNVFCVAAARELAT